MKKILNKILLLALLVLVPAVIVSAENTTNNGTNAGGTGTIKIENPIDGKTYKAYQVLVLESYSNTNKAYTYKVPTAWEEFFKTGYGKDYVTFDAQKVVTWNSDKKSETDMKLFAQEALKYAESKNMKGIDPTTQSKTTVKWEGLNLGYYLVDSSVGALCSLTTTKPDATTEEKNSVPSTKKEVEVTEGTYGSSNTASIGDTVKFKTTINVGDGAQTYKLYDKMSEGLTLDEKSIKVYLNGTEVKAIETKDEKTITNYTIDTERNDYTFVIQFDESFAKNLTSKDVITVEYEATLNEKAIIAGDGNTNETFLKYGDENEVNKTPTDKTTTYTYEFDLVKTDSKNKLLDGAIFELYKVEKDGTAIALIKVADGIYRVANTGETGTVTELTTKNGKLTIRGLGNGTWYLEETTAPDGYNKLTERKSIEIKDKNNNATIEQVATPSENGLVNTITGGLHVINLTGDELPTTGGMGAILFITIGSIMVLGFGVLLVTKLRISKMEI